MEMRMNKKTDTPADYRKQFLDLEVTKIAQGHNNVYIWAKHPGWTSEYTFCVVADNGVKGKTSSGTWRDLSNQSSEIIRSKMRSYLVSRTTVQNA